MKNSGAFIGHDKHTTKLMFNWLIERLPKGGGGSLKYARITGKAGTSAPFQYSGIEIEYKSGAWVDKTSGGDDLGWKIRNAYELGTTTTGGNPMAVGDIVMYSKAGDIYVTERSAYKGTY